jgi:hypothetical protein
MANNLLKSLEINPPVAKVEDNSEHKTLPASARNGDVMVPMWITPEARKAIKMLALKMDRTQESLLREAANDLLAKYGKARLG